MKPARLGSATLTLSPWASEALSLTDQDRLAMRAVELHARIGAIARKRGGPWGIAVSSWETVPYEQGYGSRPRYEVSGTLTGNLAAAMDRMLDQYEAEVDRQKWTAEELLTIANQSGMSVSRA